MKTIVTLAVLVTLGLAPGLAQEEPPPPAPPPPETAPPPEPPTETPPPEWKNKGARLQGEKLAAEFGVTQQAVYDLRAGGLGWGEVRHALAIARRADKPVSEVLKLRDSGMGWGKIARHYGFTLGEAGRKEGKGKTEASDDTRDAVGERREVPKDRAVPKGTERAGERGGRGSRADERAAGRGAPRGWGRGGSKR
jgi:hypothetical protein